MSAPAASVDVQHLFHTVCRLYFPHWQQGRFWTIRHEARAQWTGADGSVCLSSEQGYCERSQRRIFVQAATLQTMIHECCHAVTADNHGQRWQARMRQAAHRAKALGEHALATALAAETESYNNPLTLAMVPVAYWYGLIEDWVMENPALSLEAIQDAVVYALGVTRTEVMTRFRRLPQVYTKAQRAAERRVQQRRTL
jgi:hypothetical protein